MSANEGILWLSGVPQVPEDAIFALQRAFSADKDPRKLNLGIGAYRTSEGKPYVLEVVREAERRIQRLQEENRENHEYLAIAGSDEFIKAAQRLGFGGDSALLQEQRVASVQSVSGTGALRLGLDFVSQHAPSPKPAVYVSNPTWGNHKKLVAAAGLGPAREYRYYDASRRRFDLEGMLADLSQAPPGSVVIMQPCGHNPTGYDPSIEEWAQIAGLCASKGLVPFFDNAYQGYASGDLARDGASIRLFSERGFHFLLSQSFSKNFGLYSERIGLLSIVTPSADAAKRVFSQLQAQIRADYSNPPKHGALIVSTILGDDSLRQAWIDELRTMSERIIEMRRALFQELKDLGTPGEWSHIVKQIGMFSYTGLNAQQVKQLIEAYHIYMTSDGRINVAGLSYDSIKYFASAVHAVISESRL
ncbi:MAG: aspartate aminotransferase [archaeon]|nr:aspartate aminotransferase [archaeon]